MSGSGEKKQLGRIMLQQKLVNATGLEALLKEQRAHPEKRLASITAASGQVSEVDLLRALSEQHGVPGIDLAQVVVPLENLALIPFDIAKQHSILPILVKDDRLFLAMADPSDRRVVDEIEFVTGRRTFPYVALHEGLQLVIDACYVMAERGEAYYVGPHVPADYLEQIGLTPAQQAANAVPSLQPEPMPDRGGVVSAGKSSPPSGGAVPGEVEEFSFANIMEDEDIAAKAPPLDPAFESRVAPLPTAPTPQKKANAKILVVDDEDDIRRLLRRVLTERGYQVVEASKGLEALAAVRDHQPDVILLDAMLPEVHGFDICRRIKGSKRYGHIPIIMVSAIYRGWRFAEDLKASYGVDSFLEKPFKIGEVLAAVDRAANGRKPDGSDAEALSEEARAALTEGIDAFKRGDLDTAIEHLRRGVGIDPLAFRLHYHLGLLYGRREANIFEAIQALETAVDLAPKNFPALKNLAVVYQRAGFKHKAVEMWERALGCSPDDETKRGIKDHLMSLL
jgi:CheY-like chemotaxis protein